MTLVHSGRVSAAQLRRDRARTRRELAKSTRKAARERIRSLREQIRSIKRSRPHRLQRVRMLCQQAREDERERARRRREELKEAREELRRQAREARAIARAARDTNRARCHTDRAAVPVEIAAEVSELEREIRETKDTARAGVQLDAAIATMERDRRTPAERRAEAEDEVAQNIPAELLPVWEAKKSKIRAGKRSSLTEAFLQWVHDHSAEVSEILYSDELAELRRIDRDEAALSREYRRWKKRGGQPSAKLRELLEESGELAPVASSSDDGDDWGGL